MDPCLRRGDGGNIFFALEKYVGWQEKSLATITQDGYDSSSDVAIPYFAAGTKATNSSALNELLLDEKGGRSGDNTSSVHPFRHYWKCAPDFKTKITPPYW